MNPFEHEINSQIGIKKLVVTMHDVQVLYKCIVNISLDLGAPFVNVYVIDGQQYGVDLAIAQVMHLLYTFLMLKTTYHNGTNISFEQFFYLW